MAILDRIRRIAQANIAHLLSQMDAPEDELTVRIRELEEASRDAKDALASFAVTYKRLEKNVATLETSARDCQDKAEGALKAGNESAARSALADRIKVEARIKTLTPVLDSRRETYDELKDDLLKIHDQLNKARALLADLRARQAAAEAEKAMGESVSGLSKTVSGAFEHLEDEVAESEARAEIEREIRGGTAPRAFGHKDDATQLKIDAELAALKEKILK